MFQWSTVSKLSVIDGPMASLVSETAFDGPARMWEVVRVEGRPMPLGSSTGIVFLRSLRMLKWWAADPLGSIDPLFAARTPLLGRRL